MFFDGSRYLRVKDWTVAGPDGRPVKVKRLRTPAETPGSFQYEVKEGDRLDLLAYRFYRASRKWWLICDANPDLMHPLELLTPGRRIVIPPDRAV
jgi:nucleoid-associated protein YgaU